MYIPLCCFCRRFKKDMTCKAYPDGIPSGVYTNRLGHFRPMRGDNGIVFEPEKNTDKNILNFLDEWRNMNPTPNIPPGIWVEDAPTDEDRSWFV